MYSLVYVSSAVHPFSKDELRELLKLARVNNEQCSISGLLLYKDGNFMQVLEGHDEDVRDVYAKISRDQRHRGMLTLLQGEVTGRKFPDWSMGFRDLNSTDAKPDGYSEFLTTPLNDKEFTDDPSRAQKLLLMFKKSM